MILDANGRPASGEKCLHSEIVVEFDEAEAKKILGGWEPNNGVEFNEKLKSI
jgi:hypothetical protein